MPCFGLFFAAFLALLFGGLPLEVEGAPVNCVIGQWTSFSACSHGGINGTICEKQRTRDVISVASEGGSCDYVFSEVQACAQSECVNIDECEVTEWTAWTPCSVSCSDKGTQGVQTRSRSILSGTCNGVALSGTQMCNSSPCSTPMIQTKNGDLVFWVPATNSFQFVRGSEDAITFDGMMEMLANETDDKLSQLLSNLESQIQASADGAYDSASAYTDNQLASAMSSLSTYAMSAATTQSTSALNKALSKIDNATDTLNDYVDSAIGSVRADLGTVEKELSDLLAMHSSNISIAQSGQSDLLASAFSQIADLENGLSTLGGSKADKTAVNALSDRVTAVQANLTSTTNSLKSSINALNAKLLPDSPRVSVSMNANYDIYVEWEKEVADTFELKMKIDSGVYATLLVGVNTSYVVSEPIMGSTYTFVVTATNAFGSGVATVSTFKCPDYPTKSRIYTCTPAAWSNTAGQYHVANKLCTVSFTVTKPTLIVAGEVSHVRCDAYWEYVGISINGDMDTEPEQMPKGPSHTYSSTWENSRSKRVAIVNPGTVTVSLNSFSYNQACYINGPALFVMAIEVQPQNSGTFGCTHTAWSFPIAKQSNVVLCSVTATIPGRSLVYGSFMGHAAMSSSYLYGSVSFNGDASGTACQTQSFSPSLSFTTNWESFGNGRAKIFNSGSLTAGVNFWADGNGAAFNGGGFMGFYIPTGGVDNYFSCTPETWGKDDSGDTWKVQCSTVVNLPYAANLWVEYTAHVQTTGSWCYSRPYIQSFLAGSVGDDWGNAHTYSTVWESNGAMRVFSAGPGPVTVGIITRCGSTGNQNGLGMQGFFARAG